MDWTPEQIKALRERHGLSQTAFADALGLSRAASVSDLETGRQAATGQTARLLDVVAQHGPEAGRGSGGSVADELDRTAAALSALAHRVRAGE